MDGRCVALRFHNLGRGRGGWSTPRPGRFTPRKETRYPLYRRLGGTQVRSGRVRKIPPPPGFDSRTFQPVTPTTFSRPPISRVHELCFMVRGPIPVTGLCVFVLHLILTASRRHLVTDVETNCRTANQDTSQNLETVLSSAGNDSSVGVVTRLCVRRPTTLGSIPGGGKIRIFRPRIPDQQCNTLSRLSRFLLKLIGKGKGQPRTDHEGPKGEQMYSSTLPPTSALDGVGGQHHVQAALPPGKDPVPIVQEAGGPQGRSGRVRKISPTPGFDPRTVEPVGSRCTD